MALETINRIPKGLLSLLELKTGGITPPELAEQLQSQLDLLPFYLSGNIESEFDAAGASVAGASVQVVVPDGEVWILSSVRGCIAAATIPTNYTLLLSHLVPGAVGGLIIGEAFDNITGIGLAETRCVFPNPGWGVRPLVMAPGSGFFLELDVLGAGNATLIVTVAFMRLRT